MITQFETRIEHAAVTHHVQMIATVEKMLFLSQSI